MVLDREAAITLADRIAQSRGYRRSARFETYPVRASLIRDLSIRQQLVRKIRNSAELDLGYIEFTRARLRRCAIQPSLIRDLSIRQHLTRAIRNSAELDSGPIDSPTFDSGDLRFSRA